MEDPKSHNPLVVKSEKRGGAMLAKFVADMFRYTGISATFYIKVLRKDKDIKTQNERRIEVLPIVEGNLCISVQIHPNERYICSLRSPEIRKKDIHDALTARLMAGIFNISTPVCTIKPENYQAVLSQLAEFHKNIDEAGAEERKLVELLAQVRKKRHELCRRIDVYVKKNRVR